MVKKLTGVRIAIRKRPEWAARMLTLAGPKAQIEKAKDLAIAFIIRSQANPPRMQPMQQNLQLFQQMQQFQQMMAMGPWMMGAGFPMPMSSMAPAAFSCASGTASTASMSEEEEEDCVDSDDDWEETCKDEAPSPVMIPDSPAYGIKKVVIYCLGLQTLGVPSYWHCFDDSMTRRVVDAFDRRYAGYRLPDIYMDCRMFNEKKCPKHHCGEHTDFIIELVVGRLKDIFHGWLKEFKETFEAHEQKHPSTIPFCIGMTCYAGIHNSVGLGRISEHILGSAGYNVELIWLSPRNIDERGICTWCPQCQPNPPSKAKAEALHHAFRLWNTL